MRAVVSCDFFVSRDWRVDEDGGAAKGLTVTVSSGVEGTGQVLHAVAGGALFDDDEHKSSVLDFLGEFQIQGFGSSEQELR